MTVLVVLVAVFLAYNANNGLPFVPTKELKVDIASGSDLVAGNEVREGGFRIGLVQQLKPIELQTGQVAAQLTLQLDKAYGNVPVNSTAAIRPRSVLGLKYVDLHKGTSTEAVLRRRDDADHPDERAGPVRGRLPDVRSQDPHGDRQEPRRLRRHPGRPRLGAERHDRQPAVAARPPAAGRPLPVGAEHAS